MARGKNDRLRNCTAVEAEVLSMIKAWPGVPAIVTHSPECGWSVCTSPGDVQKRRTQISGGGE